MKKTFLIIAFLALSTLAATYAFTRAAPAHPVPSGALMLSDFEDIKAWDISPEENFPLGLSKEYVTEGAYSLKAVYPPSGYPSINTKKLKHDWKGYDLFSFDVYNPQNSELSFVVRFDDNKKRRTNINYPLKPGWNHVKIPRDKIGRSINADSISRIVLFLNSPRDPITLYFDNMKLEKTPPAAAPRPEPRPAMKEEFEPLVVQNLLPQKGIVRVQVANLTSPHKDAILVSSGVPFAQGQLQSEQDFALFDTQKNEIPIAATVLARWSLDNSIRSLLVQFSLEVEHKYKPAFIRWGTPRSTQDLLPTKVAWGVPEGIVLLPAEWLCLTHVTGEQVPVGKHPFPAYDEKMAANFQRLKDVAWTGDVVKDSYYDTVHVFYQIYARTGDAECFTAARRETLHYREGIIMEGSNKGRHSQQEKARYIYVQGMVDDYLFTGDPKSLEVAGYMAEYLKNSFKPSQAFFPRNGEHFWTEREAAFPFIGVLTYYELTGKKEYLEYAKEIMHNLYRTQNEWPERGGFIHNLYSHDPEEGAERDEYGGSPFMTGLLLEGIVKYHELTGSTIAKDSIFRALDWLMRECVADDGKSFVYTTCRKNAGEGHPDLDLLIAHAFGYGYRISGYARTDYLDVGTKVFEEGTTNGYVGDRKHFNQDYRSSGHFLAYIARAE